MRASNGVSLPRQASTVSAPATNAAAIARSAANRPAKRERRRHLRAVEQRQPLLRPEHDGRESRGAQRIARRASCGRRSAPRLRRSAPTRDARAARDRPTRRPSPARECTERRRRSRARRSASITLQRTPECPRASEAALSARIEANDGVVEQRSGARRMREHERALQLREARLVDARAREQPEAGVDAVDRASARRRRARPCPRPHRRPTWPPASTARRERRGPQAAQVGEGERAGAERQRGHGGSGNGRSAALCRRTRAFRHRCRAGRSAGSTSA